jgi:S1-C subfamily serine protease
VNNGSVAPLVVEAAPLAPAVAALADEEQVFGCQITELKAGGAAQKAGLLVGDVILAVGDTPTPDYAALRAALESAGSEVEAVFLNKENGEVERIVLHPVGSLIGATVEEVQVR